MHMIDKFLFTTIATSNFLFEIIYLPATIFQRFLQNARAEYEKE